MANPNRPTLVAKVAFHSRKRNYVFMFDCSYQNYALSFVSNYAKIQNYSCFIMLYTLLPLIYLFILNLLNVENFKYPVDALIFPCSCMKTWILSSLGCRNYLMEETIIENAVYKLTSYLNRISLFVNISNA